MLTLAANSLRRLMGRGLGQMEPAWQPDGYPIDQKSTRSIYLESTGLPHDRCHPGLSQDLSP